MIIVRRATAGLTFDRGRTDCIQDSYENVPFSSVGGLERRYSLVKPRWILDEDAPEYLAGYTWQAQELYGDDWRTCPFSWQPAITIGGDQ